MYSFKRAAGLRASHTLRRGQRGFSLIELMVGLAIGLIVVTALLVLFANASSIGQNLARSSTQTVPKARPSAAMSGAPA